VREDGCSCQKCDAVRPHCGTCVRSLKHAMRTSPKTNPVMACDYDDEGLSGSVNASGSGPGPAVIQDDDEEGERKRKRKTNSGGAKKKDGDDTASLLKRIRMSSLLVAVWS